ncbi:MAG TPA: SH3 domain-containing protein [Leptolyngbyaceae cyanobacterium M65_K2018_010]|nr:SH3 domain-containing protein [Leptolyngbyaceae cyanobacterium M65_K2018_010]
MKWLVTALWLGLLTTACQSPAPVSQEPEPSTPEPPEVAVPGPVAEAQPPVAEPTTPANPAPTSATPIKTGTVRAEPSLRIHTAPGTNTPVIYAAPNGTRLEIFAETAMGDSTWYQVRSNLSQELGWAYGGNISVDGQAGLSEDRPTTTPADPSLGYREGYRLGYRDGQNFKKYNSGYNPDAALQAGSGNPDPAYDQAYRRGFYAGFEAGYNGKTFNDSP